MRVGDLVIPSNPDVVLASGTGRYLGAVVASMSPFVLVSVEGDMTWTGYRPSGFHVFCQVSYPIRARAVRVYEEMVASAPKVPEKDREKAIRELVRGLVELALEWRSPDCAFINPAARYVELKREAQALGYVEPDIAEVNHD
jgi:hypothetical protein